MANRNRGERLPGEVLAPADIMALLRACNQGPTGARNRALLVVLWRGGLRIAEALALRPVDLDAAAGLVRVRRGNGGRPRHVGLDPEAFAAISCPSFTNPGERALLSVPRRHHAGAEGE